MGQPVIHFEVVGRDGPSLRAFYTELFGWEIDTDNPAGYGLIGREGNVTTDGVGIGGGIGTGTPDHEGHITFYVLVPDIEAALIRVESLGGTRLAGPHVVLDRVEIGAFCDPEGHMIGLVHATQP
jgi:predicted enzyme related to lactoylglutathione lyase